jgi:integrase
MPERIPKYRLHRPSGQAVVTVGGRDVYLGKHGSRESRDEYDRVVGEWLASRPARRAARPHDRSVGGLLRAYLAWADGYYRKDGRPTSEPGNIRAALRPLRRLYGVTPARDFGPLALKAVRRSMIEAGLCRNEVNKRAGQVTRMFRWAAENELVPASVHHGLRAVAGLRKGRSEARESEPVRPVPDADVEAIRPFLSRQVWAMVTLMRLTGMRPGEACSIRACDLDRTGPVWVYRPESHKTEHHGRDRVILIGPRAKEILVPWLGGDASAYLFSPAEAVAEMRARARARRQTPLTPSQRARRPKARPEVAPGGRYTKYSLHQAVRRACLRAGVPPWGPGRLRHNAATMIRREFGLDAARAVLGHTTPAVTAVYAEADMEKAAEAMERLG